MTESDDDYGGDHEHQSYESRRSRISSSMQRSVDSLLGRAIDSNGNGLGTRAGDAVIDENGKITFDRRLFDFDTYRAVIDKV